MTKRTGGDMEELVRIVAAADGELVGRTRLQKTAFLLELAGLGTGFEFKYKHQFFSSYFRRTYCLCKFMLYLF